ncbi:hypothetical protein HYV81_02465 [Candidatus Woesearchaeota archaeon]|nr:hypothetical protein [Candidatus Woesearchaeota archaeon]
MTTDINAVEGKAENQFDHMSELMNLKDNMDSWVKHINAEMGCVRTVSKALRETIDNTEHNYELAQEMRQEIEELKQEIKLLKIIQLTMLKSKPGIAKQKMQK